MNQKSKQEELAEQRHIELLTGALDRAKANGGLFLNADSKLRPQIYLKGTTVTSFNALMLALNSDEMGYKTNLYSTFTEARKRGDAVLTGQKGVPFVWYSWNQFQSKADPDQKISREDYQNLSESEQQAYKPLRQREVKFLFNIEQTTMPYSNKIEFEDAVKVYGAESARQFSEMDDKRRRMEVNRFIQNVKENLVSVRKDGTGIARYDSAKDLVFLPAQKHFSSYADYVQEAVRQIATATGHPQRLSRQGTNIEGAKGPTESQAVREKLIVELASAVKMAQFGLPAKISYSNLPLIDSWKELIQAQPHFVDAIEAEVNNSLSMMSRAEQGEKVGMTPVLQTENSETEDISAQLFMLKDEQSRWMLFLKPEDGNGFAIYPDKEDVNQFFVSSHQGKAPLVERVRQELAQKYYNLAQAHPELKVNLMGASQQEDVDSSLIERVNIFKTKEKDKVLCLPTITGAGKLTPREVSPMQWQMLWISDDRQAYKTGLAASLFSDIIREVQQKQTEVKSDSLQAIDAKISDGGSKTIETQTIEAKEEENRGYHR